jgi:hypothetical protein
MRAQDFLAIDNLGNDTVKHFQLNRKLMAKGLQRIVS